LLVLLFFLFFYAFVQYFSTWPKGCLRARGWLRLAPRFWAILYPVRGAHLLQAAFENSKLFFGIAVSSLLRAAIPSGPELL